MRRNEVAWILLSIVFFGLSGGIGYNGFALSVYVIQMALVGLVYGLLTLWEDRWEKRVSGPKLFALTQLWGAITVLAICLAISRVIAGIDHQPVLFYKEAFLFLCKLFFPLCFLLVFFPYGLARISKQHSK